MGDVFGFGISHYPPFAMTDPFMSGLLKYTLGDPDIPAEDLRQRLYRGDLVILTRLRTLSEFVDYMRDELTGLFAPYDPEHAHEDILGDATRDDVRGRLLSASTEQN